MRPTRSKLVMGTAAALLLVAGGAVASTPDPGGPTTSEVITACVSVRTGIMRIPTHAKPCMTNGPRATRERVVTWDAQAGPGGDGSGGDGADGSRYAAGITTYRCADSDVLGVDGSVAEGVGYDPALGRFVIAEDGAYRIEVSGRGPTLDQASLVVTVNGEPNPYLADRARSGDVESSFWAVLGATWVVDLVAGDALGLSASCFGGHRPDDLWSARLVLEKVD
jgi:hypothetical protein